MEIFVQIFGWTIIIAISLFLIVSIVLFIKDGINAKQEGRDRKKAYKVMFIISMAIIGLAVVIGIMLCVLAALIMRSM